MMLMNIKIHALGKKQDTKVHKLSDKAEETEGRLVVIKGRAGHWKMERNFLIVRGFTLE